MSLKEFNWFNDIYYYMIQLNNRSDLFNRTLIKNTIFGVCFALTLPLWTSCNNDLFVDEFLAQDVSQTVSCGDSAVVQFDGSNWNVLSVGNNLLGAPFNVKSYDSKGNLLSENTHSGYPGMARIVGEDEYNYLEIKRVSGRELKFCPLEMMHDSPFDLDVVVGNEYEQRTLRFTINPSPKYQVDSIAYDWNSFDTYDNELKVVNNILIDNGGSSPMTYYAYPYKNGVRRTFMFYWNPSIDQLTRINQDERLRVPDVENGKPVLRDTQIPIGENGKTIELPLDYFDTNLCVPVVINPHDKRYVVTYHEMENYTVSCTLYMSHPISHRKNVYKGKLSSARPFGHLILKLEENLYE